MEICTMKHLAVLLWDAASSRGSLKVTALVLFMALCNRTKMRSGSKHAHVREGGNDKFYFLLSSHVLMVVKAIVQIRNKWELGQLKFASKGGQVLAIDTWLKSWRTEDPGVKKKQAVGAIIYHFTRIFLCSRALPSFFAWVWAVPLKVPWQSRPFWASNLISYSYGGLDL